MRSSKQPTLSVQSVSFDSEEIILNIGNGISSRQKSPSSILSIMESKGLIKEMQNGIPLVVKTDQFENAQHELVHLFMDIESIVDDPSIFFESAYIPKKQEVTDQFDVFISEYRDSSEAFLS